MRTTIFASEHCQRGLTLVELLIGLVLIGMMSTILLQALQLASRAWSARALPDARLTETAMVREWIRRQLKQAQPVAVDLEMNGRMLAFSGEPDAVTFVATVPAPLGGGGLRWIEFRTIDTEGGRRLIMTHELFHPDVARGSQPDSRVLIERIESARFDYFGSKSKDEPSVWHDSWVEMDYLPSLVRLSIEPSGENPTVWPAILAAPVIDGARPAEYRPIANTVVASDG